MQDRVNQILSQKTIDIDKKEVIRGDWGNGEERNKYSQKPVMTMTKRKEELTS